MCSLAGKLAARTRGPMTRPVVLFFSAVTLLALAAPPPTSSRTR